MKTNYNRFWIIVILLGWAFDFLFWKKPAGINFAIYVALCLGTGILLLRAEGLRFSRRSGLLLLPIAFLAAMTFIRLEPLTMFLSIVAALFLMGIFTLTYLSGEWIRRSEERRVGKESRSCGWQLLNEMSKGIKSRE